jgi:hypothetical protein
MVSSSVALFQKLIARQSPPQLLLKRLSARFSIR